MPHLWKLNFQKLLFEMSVRFIPGNKTIQRIIRSSLNETISARQMFG